jgi:hypothetical protein
MSTVAKIKEAIDSLSTSERVELEALLWSEWDWPLADESADPPQLREKLAAAATGRFQPGNRENIDRILKSLE